MTRITTGAIIPTRGDREVFLNHCKEMLGRQTEPPDVVLVIDHEPKSNAVDLTERYRIGYEKLTKMGIDLAFFIEDDDYYNPYYFQECKKLMGNADMIGFNNTIYYHLFLRKWRQLHHNTHSSMFQTVMRTGLNFNWPYDDTLLLDIELWRDKHINKKLFQIETGCVGIKHGVGKCGGKGHLDSFWNNKGNSDQDLAYLKELVKDEFPFYLSLAQTKTARFAPL